MKSRRPLVLFAALGLGSSTTSSYVHYQAVQNPAFSSFCDVNATVSCTQAYLSPYGTLFGAPVALLGVFFFATILAIAALGGRRTPWAGESAPAYIFGLSTIGMALVLYLGYASVFVLKSLCVLCGITYLATVAVFILSGRALAVPITALPGRAARDVRALTSSRTALGVIAALVIGAVSALAAFSGQPPSEQQSPLVIPLTEQQKVEIARWWDLQPKF